MSEENLGIAQKFCRTCVKQLCQDDAFDIFLVPGLAKKLCVCTSLTVEQQDGFPTNICPTCYNRLNDLHDFQAQCISAVQQFKEMLLACSSGHFSVVNAAADLEADVAFEESEHTHFDPLLNSKIEIEYDQDVFKMIEAVDKESVEDEEERQKANDSFEDEDSDYNAGMDSSDSDYTLPLSNLKGKGKDSKETKKAGGDSVEIESKVKPQRLLECHICMQKFKKTCIYQEHMKLHDDQLPHQCPVESCKIGFTTPNGLRHHIEHMHTELCQMLSCTVEGCNKQFPLKRSLTRHLRIMHNMAKPETHPCSECEKVFRCPMALKKHMYKHTGEELPFCCDICKRRFATSTELRHHLLRHAGIKNFICTYCGVRKTTKQELDNHILTHTREKNLKCDKCDYLTHCKQSLWKHTRVVHMKIKKHACSYCEKTFGNAYARRTHERLHTGESCFECTICSRMFLFEKTLTTHLKTHEKREKLEVEKKERKKKVKKEPETVKKLGARVERVDIARLAGTVVNPIPTVSVPPPNWEDVAHVDGQVICPECGKSFNRKEGMKLHYKVVHQKVKDYICRFCSKRFGRLQYLKAHENIHTGATPFKCNICDMAFKGDSALFVHKKRKHCPKIAKPAKVPKTPRAPKPKPPKPAIESQPTERCKRSKTKLNMHPKNQNHEQFEDPAAERAAAQAQLFAHQENKNEIKLKAAEETQKIQTAAQEQLEILKRLSEKMALDSLPSIKN